MGEVFVLNNRRLFCGVFSIYRNIEFKFLEIRFFGFLLYGIISFFLTYFMDKILGRNLDIERFSELFVIF